MTQEMKMRIALSRYSVISPLVNGTADPGQSHNQFFIEAAQKTYAGPYGTPMTVGASTVEKWYLAYKKRGFDALIPKDRSDMGDSRKLIPDMQDQILYFMKEFPDITAAEIERKLLSSGSISPGEISSSTISRFVRHKKEDEGQSGTKDMRRYERPHINEVWYGDTCFGPYMQTVDGKKRIYIIALIDDASRMVVGAGAFFNDNFENLMTVIRSAVSKYGRPKLFSFDNGSTYRNMQMELLAARIGSAVHYCEPYTPTSKSKIERWFLTCRMQYLSVTDVRGFHTLSEMNDDFLQYVSRYNRSVHSSLSGISPQDRFFSEPEYIRRLSEENIDHDFLLEAERKVSSDSVITIDRKEYEVHYQYAKKRIRIRYSPDLEKVFVVGESGELTPIQLLDKQSNANVKRQKTRLTEGGESA